MHSDYNSRKGILTMMGRSVEHTDFNFMGVRSSIERQEIGCGNSDRVASQQGVSRSVR